MYDVNKIREDFPIFALSINGKPNTFLDSAASAQKPKIVIDKMNDMYTPMSTAVHICCRKK